MPRISHIRRKATYLFLSYIAATTLLSVPRVYAQGRESAEVRLTRGMLLYEDKKYEEATRELLQAHQLDPRNANVVYYLALSLSAQGRNAEAEAYVRKGLEVQPKNANLRLMLAYTLRAQGKTEASRQVAESLQLEPASPLVGASRDLLTSLRTPRRGDTPFWLEATARAQYDSNVSLKPNAGSGTSGIGRASSWGDFLGLSSEYAFFRSPNWQSAARYDMYQTINYSNHKFDYSDHVVGGRLTYTDVLPSAQRYFLTFRPFYDILLQQGREFLQRPTALLDSYLYWDPTGSNRTQLFYQFEEKLFNEHPSQSRPALGHGDENRDGQNYRVGLVHYMFFDRQRYGINFGYNYDFDDTHGDNWRYAGHRAVAGFLATLPWEIRATTNFEFHARHYNGVNSKFTPFSFSPNVRRHDQEFLSLFSLAKDITPHLTVSLEHLWDSNLSSIADFRFRREVISLGVTWRYF
ncbi:MAG TPA: tetratricopeptide repeat protein [Verrucomicrobiae bacterium]|nr:tetratricopeptide repeat protein [Verrucomicrobiae bacterium]